MIASCHQQFGGGAIGPRCLGKYQCALCIQDSSHVHGATAAHHKVGQSFQHVQRITMHARSPNISHRDSCKDHKIAVFLSCDCTLQPSSHSHHSLAGAVVASCNLCLTMYLAMNGVRCDSPGWICCHPDAGSWRLWQGPSCVNGHQSIGPCNLWVQVAGYAGPAIPVGGPGTAGTNLVAGREVRTAAVGGHSHQVDLPGFRHSCTTLTHAGVDGNAEQQFAGVLRRWLNLTVLVIIRPRVSSESHATHV